jgi:hypothetical protein
MKLVEASGKLRVLSDRVARSATVEINIWEKYSDTLLIVGIGEQHRLSSERRDAGALPSVAGTLSHLRTVEYIHCPVRLRHPRHRTRMSQNNAGKRLVRWIPRDS